MNQFPSAYLRKQVTTLLPSSMTFQPRRPGASQEELDALVREMPEIQSAYNRIRLQLDQEFPGAKVTAEATTDPDTGCQSVLVRLYLENLSLSEIIDRLSDAQDAGRVDDPDPCLISIVAA